MVEVGSILARDLQHSGFRDERYQVEVFKHERMYVSDYDEVERVAEMLEPSPDRILQFVTLRLGMDERDNNKVLFHL